MPAERPFGTMSELYPALFRAGEPFYGFVYDGRWLTVDTPADLAATDAALRRDGLPMYMTDSPSNSA
jgi:NDP-sugar pyrophosphorylase family protein